MDELARVIAKAIKIVGWLILAVVVLAVLGGATWGGYYLWDQNRISQITAEAVFGDPSCEAHWPVRYTASNNTGQQIDSITLKMSVKKAGFSKELVSWDDGKVTSSRIIPPGGGIWGCFKPFRQSSYATTKITEEAVALNPDAYTIEMLVKSVDFVEPWE